MRQLPEGPLELGELLGDSCVICCPGHSRLALPKGGAFIYEVPQKGKEELLVHEFGKPRIKPKAATPSLLCFFPSPGSLTVSMYL